MIKNFVLFFVLCLGVGNFAFADEEHRLFNSPYRLNWFLDGSLVTASSVLFVGGRILYKSKPGYEEDVIAELKREDIFVLDRFFMQDYSEALDFVSEVTKDISVALPLLLLGDALYRYGVIRLFGKNAFGMHSKGYKISPELALTVRMGEILVMYYEALMFSLGIKDSLKGLIVRFRPYAYGSFFSPSQIAANPDSTCSFPSGHTTAAFVGATFLSVAFGDYYPDSPLRLPVWIGSMAIATSAGILRVASGNHFVTDIVAGAIIGTLSALGVRYLHLSIKY